MSCTAKVDGKPATKWLTKAHGEQFIARQVIRHFEATGERALGYTIHWGPQGQHNNHLGASMTLARARRLLGLPQEGQR